MPNAEKMAELLTNAGGHLLPTPVLAAAGPLTETGEGMAACAAGGAAAVVARTICPLPPPTLPEPHFSDAYGLRGSALNIELWSPRPVEHWLAVEYPRAAAAGVPLIVSLGYTAEHVRQLAPLVAPFADAVELSTQFLADDVRLMAEAVVAAKAALTVPVWVKLTASGRDVVTWARAAKDAGADAVVAIGAFGPCLAIDAECGRVAFSATGGYAWMSGAAIKNIALRCVWDISRQVGIPVIGCGGVARGTDVVEYLMAGASAVQVGTAAVLHGPALFGKINRELNTWLDTHSFAAVGELIGYTLRRMQGRRVRHDHLPPLLDVDRCIGCEICPTSCVYGALEMVGERRTPGYKVRLIADRCWGCGLCATRCPTRALAIKGVSLIP
jgi:dihydroorotate dehydrogenase subfamily 1